LVNSPIEQFVLFSIRREGSIDDPEEVWSTVSEQALRDGWGQLTEDGMVYSANVNDIIARLDNTWFFIRASDNFNSYEFMRDLALEVIATSELVVLAR